MQDTGPKSGLPALRAGITSRTPPPPPPIPKGIQAAAADALLKG
jgi:hypothetical protein